MKSMTGFASESGSGDGFDWRWDVRSVNGRGLDLKLRLPSGLEALDAPLRAVAQKHLTRGSVSAQLSLKFQRAESLHEIDMEALGRALDGLQVIRSECEARGMPVEAVSAETLISLVNSGADGPDDRPDAAALKKPVEAAFDLTIKGLLRVREAEGAQLHSIISGHMAQIESLIQDAGGCALDAVIALRDRTMRQVSELMGPENALNTERLEQEVAVLATKADIREEIDRLKAHVVAARALLDSGEPIGRRLDFLTQEFNRETNTICSKSATGALTRIGLDLKTVVEQLREQAANVE